MILEFQSTFWWCDVIQWSAPPKTGMISSLTKSKSMVVARKQKISLVSLCFHRKRLYVIFRMLKLNDCDMIVQSNWILQKVWKFIPEFNPLWFQTVFCTLNEGCISRTSVENPAIDSPSGQNPAINPPPQVEKNPIIYSAYGVENFFRGRKPPLNPIFSCFIAFYALLVKLLTFLAQNWASRQWNVDFESLGGNLGYFKRQDTRMCPLKMSLKCNFSAFGYIDLVKFSKIFQIF